jgi:hypothetical protein
MQVGANTTDKCNLPFRENKLHRKQALPKQQHRFRHVFFLFLINFTLTRNAFVVVVVVVVVVVTAAQTRVFFPQSPQFSLSAAPFFDNCGKSFVCM